MELRGFQRRKVGFVSLAVALAAACDAGAVLPSELPPFIESHCIDCHDVLQRPGIESGSFSSSADTMRGLEMA